MRLRRPDSWSEIGDGDRRFTHRCEELSLEPIEKLSALPVSFDTHVPPIAADSAREIAAVHQVQLAAD